LHSIIENLKGTLSPSLLNKIDLKEIIENLCEEFFKQNESLFLVEFSMDFSKIDIKIDGDKGVKISDCIDLSKHIKNHFDTELDDYNLNVSSAGLLAPLKTYRQFLKNSRRKMKVKSKEGIDYIGNLVSVNSNDIELEWISREKKPVGKGKIDVKKNKLIAFDQIEKANLIVEFNKI
jgi:ribosome maturation factor RimP